MLKLFSDYLHLDAVKIFMIKLINTLWIKQLSKCLKLAVLLMLWQIIHITPVAAQLKANSANTIFPTISPSSTKSNSSNNNKGSVENNLDRIVAVVERDVITNYDLENRKKLLAYQLKGQDLPVAGKALDKSVLERMIIDSVLVNHARDQGVYVEDATVEQAMKRLASDRKLSNEKFIDEIAKLGLSLNFFKKEMKNEIIIARIREKELGASIQISEADIDNQLATQNNAAGGNQYHLGHILIKAAEGTSDKDLRQLELKAVQMYRRIKLGQKFSEVAEQFSDAPDAKQGGDLGWRTIEQIPALFAKEVSKLKAGETSEVIRSPNGFHVVKLFAVKSAIYSEEVEQSLVRHILIRENELLNEQEAKQKLEKIREKISKGEDFADLARLNSQDGSSVKGGNLGWISPGDTVKEFESAMNKLKINELSAVIKTTFGFHLIEVLERKKADLKQERARQAARASIYETKMEEAYDEWVRQIRDRAYIENYLEKAI